MPNIFTASPEEDPMNALRDPPLATQGLPARLKIEIKFHFCLRSKPYDPGRARDNKNFSQSMRGKSKK
jgi:hypothetical protein